MFALAFALARRLAPGLEQRRRSRLGTHKDGRSGCSVIQCFCGPPGTAGHHAAAGSDPVYGNGWLLWTDRCATSERGRSPNSDEA